MRECDLESVATIIRQMIDHDEKCRSDQCKLRRFYKTAPKDLLVDVEKFLDTEYELYRKAYTDLTKQIEDDKLKASEIRKKLELLDRNNK